MTLTEFTDEWLRLLEMAEDPETDPDTLADTMDMIKGDIEEKVKGTTAVIAELDDNVARLTEEITRLQRRKKAMLGNRDFLATRVMLALRLAGIKVIKTALRTIRIVKNSTPSVVLDVPDVWSVPEEYRRYKDPEVDSKKIAEDLKKGKELGFAHIEYGSHLRYK